MHSLQQKLASASTAKPVAVPRATSTQSVRPSVSIVPQLAPVLAPVSRARIALETRRLASAVIVQATPATGLTSATEKTSNPLPIVFVSAEVAPWSKTGGLGDVVGGLPIELAKRGHKVITVAPRYDQYSDAWDTSVVVNIDGENVRFFHSIKKGVHRVWVDHPSFLAKVWGKTGSKLYGPKTGADFVDNHKRFALFNKAAIEATRVLPFGFGEDVVFVANDWHSALVPVLIKDYYQPKGQFKKAKTALCIHNIAFQGRMWEDAFGEMKLPTSALEKFKFVDGVPKVYTEKSPLDESETAPKAGGSYKKINWLKAGILAADKLVTVSPNYASEIAANPAGGVELDRYIREKGGATGIVNGMDVEEWDPRLDKYLTIPYDKTNVYVGKAAAKEALQAEAGLPVNPNVPIFSFIGRLEEQKGVDILLAAIPKIVAKCPNAQIVILGTGKAKFEKALETLNKSSKGNVKCVVKFSAPLAHLITAGADFILVPSRFEPCGLIQLHAMQYGTVPIVSSTGGLVDTVKEGKTGFHMGALDQDKLDPADAEALASTVARASQAFSTPLFKEMVYNCISQDLGWSKPAKKWEGVLEQLFLGLSSGKEKEQSIQIPVAERIPYPVAATDKPLSPAAIASAAAAKAKLSSSPPSSGSSAAPSAAPKYVPRVAPVSAPTPTSIPATTPVSPSYPQPPTTYVPRTPVAAPSTSTTSSTVAAPKKVAVSATTGASSKE